MTTSAPIDYHGIIPPMITPLRDRDTLDEPGLERLVEHILGGGVHGLFILGTSGEAPSLSYRLRRELIDRVCRQVGGRVPVLVGITDTAFTESVQLAAYAAGRGVSAVVAAAPYYFPAGQPELIEYFEHLAQALPLPVFLYNMPMMTKTVFEPAFLERMLAQEKVIGLKDSSGNLDYYEKALAVARQRPDWRVLIGPEHLLARSVALGGHGGVNGGANFLPRLYTDLYEAAVARDEARVAILQQRVEKVCEIYAIGRHASSVIKGMKCALSLLGICEDFMAEPFHRFRDPERARVRQVLQELQVL